jgi:hypothetical protein
MNGVVSGCLTFLAAVGFVVGGLVTAWGLMAMVVLAAHDANYGSGATRYEGGAVTTVVFGVVVLVVAFICLRVAIRLGIPAGETISRQRQRQRQNNLQSGLKRLNALGIDVVQGDPGPAKVPPDFMPPDRG